MNKYINRPVVGIDVAAEFSMVAILAPDGEVYRKSFRINHTLDGFEYLAWIIHDDLKLIFKSSN